MIDLKLLKLRASHPAVFSYYLSQVFWFEALDGFTFPIPLWELEEINGKALKLEATIAGTVVTRWIRREMELQASLTTPQGPKIA